MKNIFAQRKDFVEGRKRNTFDLSFQNNLTMKFGRLYPVFCKEVIPGDSFRIKPTFGLRFMPLVFPIQTRMQANLHFFYVRNRTLWKDWMDFIGRTKNGLVPPYLSSQMAKEVCKTGKLGDYMGVPTTLVGDYGGNLVYDKGKLLYDLGYNTHDLFANYNLHSAETMSLYALGLTLSTILGNQDTSTTSGVGSTRGTISDVLDFTKIREVDGKRFLRFHVRCGVANNYNPRVQLMLHSGSGENDYRVMAMDDLSSGNARQINFAYQDLATSPIGTVLECSVNNTVRSTFEILERNNVYVDGNLDVILDNMTFRIFAADYFDSETHTQEVGTLFAKKDFITAQYGDTTMRVCLMGADTTQFSVQGTPTTNIQSYRGALSMTASYDIQQSRDIADASDLLNPYASGDIHISALPFRAYEAIYNAYYRNQLNDPFKINGTPEYNKYITNDAGGADSTVYDFFNRNWELDFLTSATQTPQQGDITPLVGVSASGDFTFQNSDGTTTVVHPTLGADGATLTGIAAYEGETPADGSLPAGVRRLAQLIPYGISINDFRNVNALQRWLETNLRRGYKYRDQIKSHFDVDVEYKELDMPEFIGGMSEPVIINQINQSVNQTDSNYGDFGKVLGSYAGQASILASSEHDIEHYCDEHGFIIGILSVSPVPNYSQLLPKHLIKDNVLDYYFPEFGHIGNQPITYREVCPVQSFAAGDSLDDVFGYQRAWYDYIASVDEVHGDMRTSLRNFLVNRVFDSRPELGAAFLQVDNDQVNDVFSVTDDTDKILGQVYFDVTAQRPIPKFGIPRLE